MDPYAPELLWVVVVSFVVAFVLAFGIGANDVANSFGTSVGSKVLTVKAACCLATVFEIAGAVLIGYKVSDTMRKGILDVSLYEGAEKELMLGCLSSLAGSGIWLMAATFLKLPISGTHSIVGATVGFSLICRGTAGLHWKTLSTIVLSWFVSPVLSGLVSVSLFLVIRRYIISSATPLIPGLRALPLCYGVTIATNSFSILHDGPKLLHFDTIPWWGALLVSLCVGASVALLVQLILVPWQRKHILEDLGKTRNADVQFTFGESTDSSRDTSPRMSRLVETPGGIALPVIVEQREVNGTESQVYKFANDSLANNNGYVLANSSLTPFQMLPELDTALPQCSLDAIAASQLNLPSYGHITPADGLSPNSSAVPLIKEVTMEILPTHADAKDSRKKEDPLEVARIFSFLQIVTASFGSFAHGGNDVSNAIGPLIAVWLIYTEGSVLQQSETPLSILLFGGIGISIGLWLWGRRVIQTVGEDLTKITPSTGFTIEIGAAMTVLLASKIGLPISTTHCKVGSVVFVGWANASSDGVDWGLFRNIIYAWVVTVPVAGFLSAIFMTTLRLIAL